ncbi:MAG: hypothetical protein FGM41_04300 [Bacteroidetes bacterium]|nr:hypothetical protein [Bacteroidota bacterium]
MKFLNQPLLFIMLLLISDKILGQNLTLSQILEIKKMDLGNVEEFLSARNWDIYNIQEVEPKDYSTLTFSYNSKKAEEVESYLTYYHSVYYINKRIEIQLHNKTKYNEYINSIKGYRCKLINSKVKQGEIIKVYRGATTTFIVRTIPPSAEEGQETVFWIIFIVSNVEYDNFFNEE